jgi:DNA repair protein SbcD/Mre11
MTSQTAPSSLRIAHIADLQAGASYVHGDKDAGGVNTRLTDSEDAWVGSCHQMIKDKVDLVLFAGDAFETSERGPTEEAVFGKGLRLLSAAGIVVRGCIGNHDSPKAVGQKHGLEMFNAYKGGNVWFADGRSENGKPPVLVEGPDELGLPVSIAYLPWFNPAHIAATDEVYRALDIDGRNRYLTERIVETLRGLAAQASLKKAPLGTLLVGHGTISHSAVGEHQESDIFRDAVIPLAELRGMPFRYQAWGHLHRAQELEWRIRYSGSTERHDYGESKEDKGWWLVTLAESCWENDTIEWRSSHPRPFLDVELERPQDWDIELASFLGKTDVEGAVIRVRYTATPEIHATVDHNAIRQVLRLSGARKIYGPQPTIIRDASIRVTNTLTEQSGAMDAWLEYAAMQGIEPPDLERLKHHVADAIEAVKA